MVGLGAMAFSRADGLDLLRLELGRRRRPCHAAARQGAAEAWAGARTPPSWPSTRPGSRATRDRRGRLLQLGQGGVEPDPARGACAPARGSSGRLSAPPRAGHALPPDTPTATKTTAASGGAAGASASTRLGPAHGRTGRSRSTARLALSATVGLGSLMRGGSCGIASGSPKEARCRTGRPGCPPRGRSGRGRARPRIDRPISRR